MAMGKRLGVQPVVQLLLVYPVRALLPKDSESLFHSGVPSCTAHVQTQAVPQLSPGSTT